MNPFRVAAPRDPQRGEQYPALQTREEILRAAGARPWWRPDTFEPECPFCGAVHYSSSASKDWDRGPQPHQPTVCVGHRGFWPFRKSCNLQVEHFHVHCIDCKAKWIIAPAGIKLEAGEQR